MGIPWVELGTVEQDDFPFVSSPDPLLWILNWPLEHPPGQVWNYNTGACHILSAILTEATGSSARDFAQAELFGPLGEEAGPWPTDNRGYCFGGHGLALRGRTMITLGRLFLDGETSGDRVVVSEHSRPLPGPGDRPHPRIRERVAIRLAVSAALSFGCASGARRPHRST